MYRVRVEGQVHAIYNPDKEFVSNTSRGEPLGKGIHRVHRRKYTFLLSEGVVKIESWDETQYGLASGKLGPGETGKCVRSAITTDGWESAARFTYGEESVPDSQSELEMPVKNLWLNPAGEQIEAQRQLRKQLLGKEAMSNDQFEIGDRVRFAGISSFGTVAGTEPNEFGKVLVCIDTRNTGRYTAAKLLVGPGHGYRVSYPHVKRLPYSSPGSFEAIPEHIGVTPNNTFSCDGKAFRPGMVGRVQSRTGNSAEVLWVGGVAERFLWHVSYEHLSWCYYKPESYTINAVWDQHSKSAQQVKGATFLVYKGSRPMTIAPGTGGYSVTAGVVLRNMHPTEGGGILRLVVAGGMPKEVWGSDVSVKASMVEPLEHPWIEAGERVEIKQEVTFRRRKLLGMSCRVVLPTDSDGDIGVQFEEDIDAGSLDGAGVEGKCLFIPVEAVEKLS